MVHILPQQKLFKKEAIFQLQRKTPLGYKFNPVNQPRSHPPLELVNQVRCLSLLQVKRNGPSRVLQADGKV